MCQGITQFHAGFKLFAAEKMLSTEELFIQGGGQSLEQIIRL